MFKRLLAMATLLIACFSATLVLGAQGAAAQDESATYALDVMTYQCEESPCEAEPTPVGDVTVLVSSEDGATDYGSCTTTIDGQPAGCSVEVDPGTTVAVTVDANTIPDGYALLDYPVIYDVPAEKTAVGDVQLYLTPQVDTVPDTQDTDAEVSATPDESSSADDSGTGGQAAELPSTGSGSSLNEQGTMPVGFELFAVISLALAGGALLLRRKLTS
jgi:hypothetical protein